MAKKSNKKSAKKSPAKKVTKKVAAKKTKKVATKKAAPKKATKKVASKKKVTKVTAKKKSAGKSSGLAKVAARPIQPKAGSNARVATTAASAEEEEELAGPSTLEEDLEREVSVDDIEEDEDGFSENRSAPSNRLSDEYDADEALNEEEGQEKLSYAWGYQEVLDDPEAAEAAQEELDEDAAYAKESDDD